jgi:hypothetical protein
MKVLQFPLPKMDRRRPENGLRRATIEAEQLEERQIDYWLSLADAAFDDSWDKQHARDRNAA